MCTSKPLEFVEMAWVSILNLFGNDMCKSLESVRKLHGSAIENVRKLHQRIVLRSEIAWVSY